MSNSAIDNFVTVEAKALKAALALANSIVERRNTIPILSCVRLRYAPNGLTIDATDLDLQATIKVDEIDGAGEWAICIGANELTRIAAASGTCPLTIQSIRTEKFQDNGKTETIESAEIEAGEAKYSIRTLPSADYPELHGERMHRIERFTNGQMAEILEKISYCISTEETRYYLNGVNWSASEKGTCFVATDGHRLAAYRYTGVGKGPEFSYTIPRKTVFVLAKHFSAADVEISHVGNGNTINDKMLEFTAPGLTLRSKLIDGTYPDFDRVIPTSSATGIQIRRDEILQAVRQATAVSDNEHRAIRLDGIGGKLNVGLKNIELGTSKVATSATWPDNLEPIGINARYFREALWKCQGEINLAVTDGSSPITIGDADAAMTRVLMPMRV